MASSSGAQILVAWPDAGLFTFPPPSLPVPLAPASAPASIMRPFNIPDDVFAAALDPKVPLTVAAVYAVTVKALNMYNRSRSKQPWAISKTRPFFAFVVLHNLFLAVYSAWTFWGMLGGMRRSFVPPMGGMAAMADSFCHLHGPAGLGASVYYNETSAEWHSADPMAAASAIHAGRPSNAQAGRIWNEGLAYYGWIFYLSKFYEVLDTFVILAKGKYSSTLQTYHNAGAMMCMWAGMRYMSAPIWMFVLVNSFIHSLMYTYYTLTVFSVKVPIAVKRTLTTLQITQFLVGASYAIVHSFITYIVPITVTRPVVNQLDVVVVPENPVAGGALEALKKFFLGSAIQDTSVVVVESVREPTMVTETVYVSQPCIVTSGETFAIWLNVLYLAPLTYLFVSFFIASYVKRSNAVHKANGKTLTCESNAMLAENAGWDAARGVEREVYGGESMASGSASGDSSPAADSVADGELISTRANDKARRRT